MIRRLTSWLNRASSVPAASSNERVLANYARRKEQTYFGLVFAGSVLSYLSFTANSIDYSVFDVVFNNEPRHVDSGDGISILGIISSQLGIHSSPKSVAKLMLAVGFVFIYWMAIRFANPMSNRLLLKEIREQGTNYQWDFLHRKLLWSLRHDIAAYSEILASHKLKPKCTHCRHTQECANSVIDQGKFLNAYSVPLWNRIYDSIEPTDLAELLTATAKCRLVCLVRLALLISIYFSILLFFAHRAFEYLHLERLWWSNSAIVLVLIYILIFVIVGALNNSRNHRNSAGGAWKSYDTVATQIVSKMSSTAAYGSAYEMTVCGAQNNPLRFDYSGDFKNSRIAQFEAKMAKHLLREMDGLVTTKLARLIRQRSSGSSEVAPSSWLHGVREAVSNFFQWLLSVESTAIDVQQITHLDEYILSAPLSPEHATECVSHIEEEIRLHGVALLSYNGPCRQLINRLGGSLCIFPIELTSEQLELLTNDLSSDRTTLPENVALGNKGYILVRCGNPQAFHEVPEKAIRLAMEPFSHRLAFEIIRNEMGVANG